MSGRRGGLVRTDSVPWYKRPAIEAFIALTGVIAGVSLVWGIVANITSDDSNAAQSDSGVNVNEAPTPPYPVPADRGPEVELVNASRPETDDDGGFEALCRDRSIRSRRNDAHLCMWPLDGAAAAQSPAFFLDPCFQRDDGAVACPDADGLRVLRNIRWGTFAPGSFGEGSDVVPPAQAFGQSYPWELVLENGETCRWELLKLPGHAGRQGSGEWGCYPDISLATLELFFHEVLDLRDLQDVDGAAFAYRPSDGFDVAFDLRVEEDGRWTVFYGRTDADAYERVSVLTVRY